MWTQYNHVLGRTESLWLPRCTPQGTGKLLMWWVGLFWTDLHDGSYLSLVMLHSRKFIGLGPGRPHLTLTKVSSKNWRACGLRWPDCVMTEDPSSLLNTKPVCPPLGSGLVLVMPMALAGRLLWIHKRVRNLLPRFPRGYVCSITWRRLPRGLDTSASLSEWCL